MKLDKATSDTLSKWICPPCLGKGSIQAVQVNSSSSASVTAVPMIMTSVLIPSISPHAPNPVTLWPPFGLRNSPDALEALGKIGESDNEDFVLTKSKSNAAAVSQKKEVAALKSLKLAPEKSMIAAAKVDKAYVPSSKPKHAVKCSMQNGAIKIPGLAALAPLKGVAGKPFAAPSSLKATATTGISRAVKSALPSSAMKIGNPASITQAPIKSVVPPTSQVKSSPALAAPLVKPTVINKGSVSSPPVASSASMIQNGPSKAYVVPRDASNATVSVTSSAPLMPPPAKKPPAAIHKLPIRYQMPENGTRPSSDAETVGANCITNGTSNNPTVNDDTKLSELH